MAQIQNTPLSKFTLSDISSLGSSIIREMEASDMAKSDFKVQFDNLVSATNNLSSTLLPSSKSIYTEDIYAYTSIRNKDRSSIILGVSYFMTSTDATIKESAITVSVMLDKFKGIQSYSFKRQNALTTNMISKATSEEYKKHIEKLGLTAKIENLRILNNKCIHLDDLRMAEISKRTELGNNNENRVLFIKAYKALVVRLNAIAELKGDTPFLPLFSFWNALIDDYRQSISLRKGKGIGGKTDNGKSSKHDPATGIPDSGEDDRPVIE